jgi:hypothetical protein
MLRAVGHEMLCAVMSNAGEISSSLREVVAASLAPAIRVLPVLFCCRRLLSRANLPFRPLHPNSAFGPLRTLVRFAAKVRFPPFKPKCACCGIGHIRLIVVTDRCNRCCGAARQTHYWFKAQHSQLAMTVEREKRAFVKGLTVPIPVRQIVSDRRPKLKEKSGCEGTSQRNPEIE